MISYIDHHNNKLRSDKAEKLAHSSISTLTLPYFTYHDIKKAIAKDTHLQWDKEWRKMSTKLR